MDIDSDGSDDIPSYMVRSIHDRDFLENAPPWVSGLNEETREEILNMVYFEREHGFSHDDLVFINDVVEYVRYSITLFRQNEKF